MRHQKQFTLSVTCFLLAFLCSMIWIRQKEENMAQRISSDILRFHVLANSNTKKDQELKLMVKTYLLDELSKTDMDSKEGFSRYVSEHKHELESSAESYMESLGYSYQADIALTQSYFPTKAYGDIVLPAGTYDAVEVRLGDGRGRNWWCVLYPRLCFVDASHAIVPDSSKVLLQDLLGEDYERLIDRRSQKLKVRFLLPELAVSFFLGDPSDISSTSSSSDEKMSIGEDLFFEES